jgi:hypothetical protein
MQDVGNIEGVIAAVISNYYLSKNPVVLFMFSCALHKYASGQYFLN